MTVVLAEAGVTIAAPARIVAAAVRSEVFRITSSLSFFFFLHAAAAAPFLPFFLAFGHFFLAAGLFAWWCRSAL